MTGGGNGAGIAGAVDDVTPLSRRGLFAALLLASAGFMELKDTNALVIALPALGASLGVPNTALSLTITSYVVTLVVCMPLSALFADRFGARRVFEIAVAVFVLGSVVCALSGGLAQLVAGRVLQGVGGSMMTPVGRLILVRSFPRSELVGLMAWFGVPMLLGPLTSPLIGGVLVSLADWPWIFWINVPLGLAILTLVRRAVPEVPVLPPRAFDKRGWVLLSAGLVALMGGLERLGHGVAGPWGDLVLPVAGIGLLTAYAFHARRDPEALIDFSLLGEVTFRTALAAGFFLRLGATMLAFSIPLLLQEIYGYSAMVTGLIAATQVLGSLASRTVVNRLVQRFGLLALLVTTTIVSAMAAGAVVLVGATPAWLWMLVAVLFIGGVARALNGVGLNTLTYARVGDAHAARGSSFAGTVQQTAVAAGVALAALVLGTGADGSAFDETIMLAAGLLLMPCLIYLPLLPPAPVLGALRMVLHRGGQPHHHVHHDHFEP